MAFVSKRSAGCALNAKLWYCVSARQRPFQNFGWMSGLTVVANCFAQRAGNRTCSTCHLMSAARQALLPLRRPRLPLVLLQVQWPRLRLRHRLRFRLHQQQRACMLFFKARCSDFLCHCLCRSRLAQTWESVAWAAMPASLVLVCTTLAATSCGKVRMAQSPRGCVVQHWIHIGRMSPCAFVLAERRCK